MDLTEYVEDFRRELVTAAEAGGEDAAALAARLLGPLESALRLTLLEALSAAAAEITGELAPGSVDLRLRGRDPEFVVLAPPSAADESHATTPLDLDDDGTPARLTLRLPEQLKPRVEAAATEAGVSVNTWLVRAAAAALPNGRRPPAPPASAQRITGWVR